MLSHPDGASLGFMFVQSVSESCGGFSAVNAHVSFPGVFAPALPPNMIVRADCVSNAMPISAFGGGGRFGAGRGPMMLLKSYHHLCEGASPCPMPPDRTKRATPETERKPPW